jgi:protocatechuate 3,4-dioxygenase beta subunit
MTAIVILATLLAQAPGAGAETEKPGAIRGTVISATTKEPVRRADVTLQPTMRAGAGSVGIGVMGGMAGSIKAVTDAEGNFSFANVAPGVYSLRSERSGFVAGQYGSRGPGTPPMLITVRPGQEVTGLRIEMTPQSVIAGRVLDDEGEPLQGVMVVVRSVAAGSVTERRPGRRGFGMGGQTQTDDRGQFRVHNLPPGKYVLQVTPGRWGGLAVAAPVPDSGEEMGYVTTYYPGVTDPSQATQIQTTAGAEMSGFDLRLKRTRVFRVRGQVLDPSGQPAKNYFVNVMPKGLTFGPLMAQQFYPLPEGGFEIRNVVPGSYRITVQSNMANREGLTFADTLEMGPQNVEGLVLRLRAAVPVKGQVIQTSEQKLDLSSMRVMLQGDLPIMQRSGPPPVKDDGTFEVENVPPGKYRLMLNAPPGGYIESIRYGDADVTAGEFEVSTSPSALQVVVRPGGASLSGRILVDAKPAPGMVYVVPSDPALRIQMMIRGATPDQNGAFTLSNLRPGDYLVFALSEPDFGIWDDPTDFRMIESKAKKVSLKDSSSETVELTIAK